MLLPLPVWLFCAGWPNSMLLHMQAAPQCGQERGAAPAPANHPAVEQMHSLVPPGCTHWLHALTRWFHTIPYAVLMQFASGCRRKWGIALRKWVFGGAGRAVFPIGREAGSGRWREGGR